MRPPNEDELTKSDFSIAKVIDDRCISLEVSSSQTANNSKRKGLNNFRLKDSAFTFDHVFGEDSTSAEIYEDTTKLLINEVLNGFNCTCFAYGATGNQNAPSRINSGQDPVKPTL